MDAPEARYVERDGALLAYQIVGDHGPDVLWVGEIAQYSVTGRARVRPAFGREAGVT